jgi:hypothetical protein
MVLQSHLKWLSSQRAALPGPFSYPQTYRALNLFLPVGEYGSWHRLQHGQDAAEGGAHFCLYREHKVQIRLSACTQSLRITLRDL